MSRLPFLPHSHRITQNVQNESARSRREISPNECVNFEETNLMRLARVTNKVTGRADITRFGSPFVRTQESVVTSRTACPDMEVQREGHIGLPLWSQT